MPPSRDPAYDTGHSTEPDAAKCRAYEYDGQRQDSVSTSRQQDFSTARSNDVAADELEVETVNIYVIIQNIIVTIIRIKHLHTCSESSVSEAISSSTIRYFQ